MRSREVLRRFRGRSASWGLVTEVSGLVMSLFTFVVVGQRLGPAEFGSLAAVLATAVLVGPLLTASPEHVVVQRIAQGMSTTDAWSRSVAVLLTIGPAVSMVMVLAAAVVAPSMSAMAVVMVSLGEIALLGLARVAIRVHEANGDSRSGARVALMNLASRGVALVAFALTDSPSIQTWATFHVIASAAAAVYAHRSVGSGKTVRRRPSLPTREDYRLGIPFALNAGPEGLLSSNDKMVLSGSGLDTDAGIYAAAYRVASIAGVPARSVLRTRYASYFKREHQSKESAVANALSIIRVTAPAGALSGIALFVAAPAAQRVLGDEFGDSVSAIRFLAFLPIVRSLSTPAANVLTGTGRQRLRIGGTLGAALLNLCLNLLFIPSYGWRAAATTTLVAEIVLLAWVWFHMFRPSQNSGPTAPLTAR